MTCPFCFDPTETAPCPACGLDADRYTPSPMHLPPGTVLGGKYRIGRVLGQGGFGITYLAWDERLHIRLAIKEYLPEGLATRSMGDPAISLYPGDKEASYQYGLEKFLDEARILARFDDHPGIISVRDFFEENNTAYCVMNYLEGETFMAHLKRKGGSLDWDTTFRVLMPVMDALREVHGAGLLHRDVSPDNIYLTREGQVKLLDFGAARYSMGERSRSLSVILKPGYAPEEQYRSKGRQGPWTDVYGLAATMYRALTGTPPDESLDRLAEDELEPPSSLNISLPGGVEQALLTGLALRAEDRFQSIADFQRTLMDCCAEMETDPPQLRKSPIAGDSATVPGALPVEGNLPRAGASGPEETLQTRPENRGVGRELFLGVVLALLIVGAGLAWYLLAGQDDKLSLSVQTVPEGASLVLIYNGLSVESPLGVGSMPIGNRSDIPPGEYIVEATMPGYIPARQELVLIDSGKSMLLELSPIEKEELPPVTVNQPGDEPGGVPVDAPGDEPRGSLEFLSEDMDAYDTDAGEVLGALTITDINNHGEMIGYHTDESGLQIPVLIAGGRAHILETWAYTYGYATDMADNGLVVGYKAFLSEEYQACQWLDTHMEELPVEYPGGDQATDVNEEGMVVGVGFTEDGRTIPFLLVPGQDASELPLPDGAREGSAQALDDRGIIVGNFGDENGTQACMWARERRVRPLKGLGGAFSMAMDINDDMLVVGWSWNENNMCRAVRWDGSRAEELVIREAVESRALAVNARGDILGQYWDSSGYPHAFVWIEGQVHDLGPDTIAVAINDDRTVITKNMSNKSGSEYSLLWRPNR